MANRKGQVTFKAQGKTWALKFTTNAMCAYEDASGEYFTAVAKHFAAMQDGQFPIGVIRRLFWAGLLDCAPDLDLEGAGDLLDHVGLTRASEIVGEAFQAAFPADDGDREAGNGKPARA